MCDSPASAELLEGEGEEPGPAAEGAEEGDLGHAPEDHPLLRRVAPPRLGLKERGGGGVRPVARRVRSEFSGGGGKGRRRGRREGGTGEYGSD